MTVVKLLQALAMVSAITITGSAAYADPVIVVTTDPLISMLPAPAPCKVWIELLNGENITPNPSIYFIKTDLDGGGIIGPTLADSVVDFPFGNAEAQQSALATAQVKAESFANSKNCTNLGLTN